MAKKTINCERSHADLERYHYKAVREQPTYVQDGITDILREEISMSMPLTQEKEVEPEYNYEPPWINKQWDKVKQLKGMILFLQEKLNKHLDSSKVDKKKDYL